MCRVTLHDGWSSDKATLQRPPLRPFAQRAADGAAEIFCQLLLAWANHLTLDRSDPGDLGRFADCRVNPNEQKWWRGLCSGRGKGGRGDAGQGLSQATLQSGQFRVAWYSATPKRIGCRIAKLGQVDMQQHIMLRSDNHA